MSRPIPKEGSCQAAENCIGLGNTLGSDLEDGGRHIKNLLNMNCTFAIILLSVEPFIKAFLEQRTDGGTLHRFDAVLSSL